MSTSVRALATPALLDQLLYTWSSVGLGNTTGFQVRAASEALSDLQAPRTVAIARYLYYDIPHGANQAALTPQEAPLCLALLDTGVERILLRKHYTGRDLYGRPGNYLIHVLAGLPETLDAAAAIRLWDARHWEMALDELHPRGTYLPEVAPEHVAAGQRFARFPQDESLRGELEFVIRSYLALLPGQRITVAAPSERVAALALGLALALPPALRRGVTFTTYEQDVTRVDATLVGTCWLEHRTRWRSSRSVRDLPETAYASGYALNTYSGRRTPLPEQERHARYAHFAAEALLSGETEQLDILLRIATKLHVLTTDALLLVFELFMEGIANATLTRRDITALLVQPRLAAAYLPDRGMQRAVANAALHREWWQVSGHPAILALKAASDHPPDLMRALFDLAGVAADEALAHLDGNDAARASQLFDGVANTLDPEGYEARCAQLVARVAAGTAEPPHTVYSRAVRAWLLAKWAHADHIDAAALDRWLAIPWRDLGWFLSLDLPIPWQLPATRHAVRALCDRCDQPDDIDAWLVVDAHVEVMREAVATLLAAPDASPVLRLFRLVWESPSLGRMDWLQFLLTQDSGDPAFHDRLVELADPLPQLVVSLVEADAPAILARSRASQRVAELLATYLDTLAAPDLRADATWSTVRAIAAADWLPRGIRRYSAAWTALGEILRGERPRPERLALVRDLLDNMTTEGRAHARPTLVPALARAIRTRDELRDVLERLGDLLSGGRWHLFDELLRPALTGAIPSDHAWLFGVYLSDAVDHDAPATVWATLRDYVAGLDEQTCSDLDTAATGWPVSTRMHWEHLRAQTREPSLQP
jgi:hypothetical protein